MFFCAFQWANRLDILGCRPPSKVLCFKRTTRRCPVLSLHARISEDLTSLLESYKVKAPNNCNKRRLLLSHYEIQDLFEYLEHYRGGTNLVQLEQPLLVHLGCKSVSQLEWNSQGICLYLDFGTVFLDWNTLNDFLGLDSQYRPMSHHSWNPKVTQGSHKKSKKPISIRNCKIRPGILLWEEDISRVVHLERLSFYSSTTKRPISLVPVTRNSPPTAIIGGFTMHRGYSGNQVVDPGLDTKWKIDCLYPLAPKSRVLDICTGLGYTLIELLRRYPDLEQLITIEVEEIMMFLQEINPWSSGWIQGNHDKTVHRLLGDATEILPKLPDSYFQVIIHDPPSQALQGNLYSYEFYCQLARVLSPRGQLYHYIGNPSSKEAGRLYQGVVERLYRAGFGSVVKKSEAFGVVAVK